MTARLLLLRHGSTTATLLRCYQGVTDQPLAPKGRDEARTRRRSLPRVETLWCSPLLRCRETARLLFPEQEARILANLRELDFGTWEGKTWAQVGDRSVYDRWCAEDPDACFPHGERLGDFRRRTTDALRLIADQCRREGRKTGAVVTHGGVLMAMLSGHGVPGRNYFHWNCPPCGGFAAELDTERLTLENIRPLTDRPVW